jgi:GTP-binding protein
MDSNDQERERGITILAKNTAINYGRTTASTSSIRRGTRTSAVKSSVCCPWSTRCCCWWTRWTGRCPRRAFVTSKAFERGLHPIVVVNKIDRPGARPDWVVEQVFDLFDALGATDEQLDFPIVYTSAIKGIAGLDHEHMAADMTPLFDTIVEQVPPPPSIPKGRCRCRCRRWTTRAMSGVIGVGRITRGRLASRIRRWR